MLCDHARRHETLTNTAEVSLLKLSLRQGFSGEIASIWKTFTNTPAMTFKCSLITRQTSDILSLYSFEWKHFERSDSFWFWKFVVWKSGRQRRTKERISTFWRKFRLKSKQIWDKSVENLQENKFAQSSKLQSPIKSLNFIKVSRNCIMNTKRLWLTKL